MSTFPVSAIAVNGNVVFAGTSGGGVYRSTDNGINWTIVNTGLTNLYVTALAVSGSIVFVGTSSDGVFRSTDNGANWNEINVGLLGMAGFYVRALAVSGTNIFMGTYGGGVYRSVNGGASWTPENDGLSELNVTALTVTANTVFAGTSQMAALYKWVASDVKLGMFQLAAACGGDVIRIPVVTQGSFDSGNTFTVELSDSVGSFASPSVIGSKATTSSDTIIGILPQSLPSGTKYRIRVVSSSPVTTSNDNGANISIGKRPQPVITGANALCSGDTSVFGVNPVAGTTFEWTVASGSATITSSPSAESISLFAAGAGKVTLQCRQTGLAGCSKDTTFSLDVNPIPRPVVSGSAIVCANQTGMSYSTRQNTGSNYLWSIVSGTATINGISTASTVALNFTTAGSVVLKVHETNASGCSKDTTFSITVGSGLTPVITSSTGAFTFCAGSSVTLDAGIANASYQWQKDASDIAGATTQTCLASQAGSYSVRVTSNGCSGTSANVAVTAVPLPTPNVSESSGDLTTQIFDTYQWQDAGGADIPGATSQSYTPSQSGTYKVRVTKNGCAGVSSGYAYTKGVPSAVIVGMCDFGDRPVSSIINAQDGHRSAIKVWNTSVSTVTLTGMQITGAPEFAVVENQFPRDVEAGDSTEVALRFMPQALQQYSGTVTVTASAGASPGRVQGRGIDLPPGSTITEVGLSPSRKEVEPGETLMVYVRIMREEPIKATAKQYVTHMDYDKRVLEYLATDYVRALPAPNNRDRRMLEITGTRGTSDTLIAIPFLAKLAEVDSTSLLFNGLAPFLWTDGGGKVYPCYSDSVVHVKICADGGKRLITKTPGTVVLSVQPEPATEEVTLRYTTGEQGYARVYALRSTGEYLELITEGIHTIGEHTASVNTQYWPSGMYCIVVQTENDVARKTVVVVR